MCEKIPLNTDLLRWLKRNMSGDKNHKDLHQATQMWGGLLLGFFFCLRISEILALAGDDVKIPREPSGATISILIRGPRNGQEKLGTTRALRENSTDLCPLRAVQDSLQHRNAVRCSPKWPPPSFRARLTETMKWAAISNNIPTEVVSTHSLRAGGGLRPSSPQGWIGSPYRDSADGEV